MGKDDLERRMEMSKQKHEKKQLKAQIEDSLCELNQPALTSHVWASLLKNPSKPKQQKPKPPEDK